MFDNTCYRTHVFDQKPDFWPSGATRTAPTGLKQTLAYRMTPSIQPAWEAFSGDVPSIASCRASIIVIARLSKVHHLFCPGSALTSQRFSLSLLKTNLESTKKRVLEFFRAHSANSKACSIFSVGFQTIARKGLPATGMAISPDLSVLTSLPINSIDHLSRFIILPGHRAASEHIVPWCAKCGGIPGIAPMNNRK